MDDGSMVVGFEAPRLVGKLARVRLGGFPWGHVRNRKVSACQPTEQFLYLFLAARDQGASQAFASRFRIGDEQLWQWKGGDFIETVLWSGGGRSLYPDFDLSLAGTVTLVDCIKSSTRGVHP